MWDALPEKNFYKLYWNPPEIHLTEMRSGLIICKEVSSDSLHAFTSAGAVQKINQFATANFTEKRPVGMILAV